MKEGGFLPSDKLWMVINKMETTKRMKYYLTIDWSRMPQTWESLSFEERNYIRENGTPPTDDPLLDQDKP